MTSHLASHSGLLAALLVVAAVAPARLAAQGRLPQHEPGAPTGQQLPILKEANITPKLNAQVPLDLTFRDETGRTVTLGTFFAAGKPVILSPVYYECPMLCSQVLTGLVSALGVLSLDVGKEFTVVTFSIDPKEPSGLARDKKAAYLDRYDRPGAENGWHFLTGDQASIERLTAAVGFQYAYDKNIDQYAHPAVIFVLTPDGRVSRYLYGIEFAPRDLRFGLIEASEGRIGSALERAVIMPCYQYDPTTGKYGLITMRLVQAGAVITVLGMLTFWFLMWRRSVAAVRPAGPGGPGGRDEHVNAS